MYPPASLLQTLIILAISSIGVLPVHGAGSSMHPRRQLSKHSSFPLLTKEVVSDLPSVSLPRTPPSGPGLGSRHPECLSQEWLIPLAPKVYAYGGLTLTEQPMLWLYLPFDVTPKMAIELTVEPMQNNSLDSFESTFIAPPLQQGFVGIPLSSVEFSIPVDEPFLWTLRLYCGGIDDTDGLDYLFANAWITRIEETDISIPIPENAVGEDLSEAYRDNGLWYDALTVLGEPLAAGNTSPSVSAAWVDLLEDGGFDFETEDFPVQYLVLPTE